MAPYQAHLLVISEKKEVISKSEEIYKKLCDTGVEVLYDDREDVSAGEKFADADLIGIPVRLVVSERNGDKIEYKERDKKESELLDLEEIIQKLKKS